jgi:predicted Fe-Mo cluster-binding NifX family protein
MKIAIPVENNTSDAHVCPSFGRAPYFLIHNTETKEDAFLNNSAVASQGGAGIKAAQTIVDQGAETLIAPRCGENAAEVLKAAGVQIYQSQEGTSKDNIAMFMEGQLSRLDKIHPGLHNHGQ